MRDSARVELKENPMNAIELCQRYFQAWMRRDAGAVLETMAPHGTYQDPTTPGPLSGEAFRGYMKTLWAAFPDLSFELGRIQALDDELVHGEWTMCGSNTGSLQGLPPTGKTVRVPGIDVIETGPDGIRRVTGYFDSALLPRQLGLNVIVQPHELGPFRFGTATAVRRSQPALPGALAVTELAAASDESVERIRELSRQIIVEQLQEPGFLSFTGAVVGRRLTTVSAWSSPHVLHAAMRRGTHAQAMREFFESGLAQGGSTAVFTPLRVGPFWRRCTACGKMSRLGEISGRCECGAALEALA
jgi:steroid delta-isomerase-like uncharacterized protein